MLHTISEFNCAYNTEAQDLYVAPNLHFNLKGRTLIFIAGASCSGKTTLAKEIQRKVPNTLVLSQDSWYKDLKDIEKTNGRYNMEVPQAYCLDELATDLLNLLCEGTVCIPTYQIENNIRLAKNTRVRVSSVIIVEGLHAMIVHHLLQARMTTGFNAICIYLKKDPKVCIARRIARDTALFGIPNYKVREWCEEHIIPTYAESERIQLSLICDVSQGVLVVDTFDKGGLHIGHTNFV